MAKTNVFVTARILASIVEMVRHNEKSREFKAVYFDCEMGGIRGVYDNRILITHPWHPGELKGEPFFGITLPEDEPIVKFMQKTTGSYRIGFTRKKDDKNQVDIEVAYYDTDTEGQMAIDQFAVTLKYKGYVLDGKAMNGVEFQDWEKPFNDIPISIVDLKKIIKAASLIGAKGKGLSVTVEDICVGSVSYHFEDDRGHSNKLGILVYAPSVEEEPEAPVEDTGFENENQMSITDVINSQQAEEEKQIPIEEVIKEKGKEVENGA